MKKREQKVIGLSYALLLLTMNEENQYAQVHSRNDVHNESVKEIEKKIKRENQASYSGVKFMQQKMHLNEEKRPKQAPVLQANSYSPRKR